MLKPDYHGGGIVNLMASLTMARGGERSVYAPLHALQPEHMQQHRNIVLLVIDGLGYHFLTRADAGGALRAHLKGRMTSVFPSTTASAVTTFLTGLAPQQHALTGWHIWFRELGCVLTALLTRPRYGGSSLGESDVDVGLLFDHVPVFDLLASRSCMIAPHYIAHSDFNRAHRGRAAVRSYHTLEQMFELTAKEVRSATEPNYVYVYWPDLDRIAHEHGIASEAAHVHLAELDAEFSRFVDRIIGTDTLLIVTADHGIIDSAEDRVIELKDHPEAGAMLVLPLCGERRIAYAYVAADRARDFESYVSDVLAPYIDLRPSRELVDGNYFGPGAPHPRLRERVGDYTLIMKDNFVIRDALFGERPYTQVGVHGGMSEQEMLVPLIAVHC